MAERKRLPATREGVTHHFQIGEEDGYINVGLYEDGTPGEVFLCMAKEGSTISGLLDTIGVLISVALQYGVPLDSLCKKLENTQFEPSGPTKNKEIPLAKSIPDYIFRWLRVRYCEKSKEGEQSEN